MRALVVEVPDLLWKDARLSEGAKVLWCYLRSGTVRRYTFRELRSAVGISHNSLRTYLHDLGETGWLVWRKSSLRSLEFQVNELITEERITVPMELLLDCRMPHSAKWLWGVLHRTDSGLDYERLQQLSGCCHESITHYLTRLISHKWLVGDVQRIAQRVQFNLKAVNPFQIQRDAELADLERDLAIAKQRSGYSLGQCLMAHMVRVLSPGTLLLENAEVPGLKNLRTGYPLQYDLFLPAYGVALEFQGPQHEGPTELFPSEEAFTDQRTRDVVKLGLSAEKGITLIRVWTHQLSIPQLRELLDGKIPLTADLNGRQHLYERLEQVADNYRRAAQRLTLPRKPAGAGQEGAEVAAAHRVNVADSSAQ